MKRKFIHNWPTLFWAAVVFVLAVLMRLPSCYESFWVDELHTAWAIWGDFADVSPRAAAGNQTPLYFYLMWIWKAIVGESEVMLRMSSVLAVALGSSLLVIGVTQATRRLSAGVLSGAILAVESNSLFFGTEFRPYAFVMLLSVIATWSAIRLIQSDTKMRKGNLRLILAAAISLAALIHPTSVVTLGLLPVAVLIFAWIDRCVTFRFQISDFISLILVAAVVCSLASSSLGHSWENRSQWRAFGQATSAYQFWAIWPWLTLAIVPGLVAVGMRWRESSRTDTRALLPMAVGLIATVTFFVASYFDWVPLWHRRYFVAVLPMLAWSAGASFAALPKPKIRRVDWVGFVAAVALLACVLWQQGTLSQWQRGQMQLVFRGEDWRGAVAWVRSQAAQDARVLIDAALIESERFNRIDGFNGPFVDYFKFPVSGPYPLNNCSALTVNADIPKLETSSLIYSGMRAFQNQSANWLVSRSSRSRIKRWLDSRLLRTVESRSFGPVHVVRYEYLVDDEISSRLKEMGFGPPLVQ